MTHAEFFHLEKHILCTAAKDGKTNGLSPMLPVYVIIKWVSKTNSISWLKYNNSSKIKVNNAELMVFAIVQEKVMHSMTKVNVFHGNNAQVIHFKYLYFSWLIAESSDMTHLNFKGYAPECPPNEVYNDCNKGYEPFCCDQSMNEAQTRQFAQVIHSDFPYFWLVQIVKFSF